LSRASALSNRTRPNDNSFLKNTPEMKKKNGKRKEESTRFIHGMRKPIVPCAKTINRMLIPRAMSMVRLRLPALSMAGLLDKGRLKNVNKTRAFFD